jgi:deoxyuridine 5'-triphosphate nucleotidohydrolase
MTKELKVKLVREGVKVPTYGTELASGFDVRAYDCVKFVRGEKDPVPVELVLNKDTGEKGWYIDSKTTVIFKTGIAVACGDHEEVQARGRSGFSLKTPMRVANAPGTIDEDFRGEIGIIMDNNDFYGRWFVPYEERIAQLIVCPITRPSIKIVAELDETVRGEGGYGSTGTK